MFQVFKSFSSWGSCDWLDSSNQLAIGPGWLEGELGRRAGQSVPIVGQHTNVDNS